MNSSRPIPPLVRLRSTLFIYFLPSPLSTLRATCSLAPSSLFLPPSKYPDSGALLDRSIDDRERLVVSRVSPVKVTVRIERRRNLNPTCPRADLSLDQATSRADRPVAYRPSSLAYVFPLSLLTHNTQTHPLARAQARAAPSHRIASYRIASCTHASCPVSVIPCRRCRSVFSSASCLLSSRFLAPLTHSLLPSFQHVLSSPWPTTLRRATNASAYLFLPRRGARHGTTYPPFLLATTSTAPFLPAHVFGWPIYVPAPAPAPSTRNDLL